MSREETSPRLAVVRGQTPPSAEQEDGPVRVDLGRFPALGRAGRVALMLSVTTGLLTHGYHLFRYPLYLTDEGIYMQRTWSLLRQARLSPYTYAYDHAPGGWITLAGWAFPLPNQLETFGNAVNTGRVLMLMAHVASVFLLFEVTRRLSGSVMAATVAAFVFNVSPLAVYYQRQVLLDNLMVFWVLLSVFTLLRRDFRIRNALGAGLAFGAALITKENAIFFAPALLYLLFRRIQGTTARRFTQTLLPFAMLTPVGVYFMYAVFKNELLPSGFDFSLSRPPADHVSLLYTMWWQVNRNQGTVFGQGGFLDGSWLPKDSLLLAAGTAAMAVALYMGLRNREKNLGFLVAGGLAGGYAFYLVRGSVVLDFYVAPVVPLFAMCVGMIIDKLLKRAAPVVRIALPTAAATMLVVLPSTGYLLTHNNEGRVQLADQYHLLLTGMQEEQMAWIRQNVSPSARIIMDDDLWSDLHDVRPFYPFAHSHWNASSDPAVRDKLFGKNWQNIDYIVMSNKMKKSMTGNNADGRESWILEALNQHSKKVWEAGQGDVKLEIYEIVK
jgi:hypothetical protein